MEGTDLRKSILKRQSEQNTGRPPKRLSFASARFSDENVKKQDSDSDEPVAPKQLEFSDSSADTDKSELNYTVEVAPICKSLRVTPMGLCYVPNLRSPRKYSASLNIVPMKENRRNVFVTALKNRTSSTIKVMIVGHKCEGETIKSNLLAWQENEADKWSLKWSQQLEIILEESPTAEDIIDTDYFIFLAHLYILDSLQTLSKKLKVITNYAMPTIKGTVLYLPSQQGIMQSIVSSEKISEFMDEHQLHHIQWIKPEKDQYLALLHRIHASAGIASISLVSKSIIRWSDKYAEEVYQM